MSNANINVIEGKLAVVRAASPGDGVLVVGAAEADAAVERYEKESAGLGSSTTLFVEISSRLLTINKIKVSVFLFFITVIFSIS